MKRYNLGTVALGVLCLSLAFTIACSDDDDSGSGGSAGSGGTAGSGGGTAGSGGSTNPANGVTPCGQFPDQIPKTCQAGQYCKDEGFSECENGCLSNTNCTSTQACIKAAGQDVGSCQAQSTGVSCADLCTKMQACDPSITQAQCDQFCAGVNDTCKTCIINANCTELMNDPPACAAECGIS